MEQNKVENKNSFMRKDSQMLKRIIYQESAQSKTKYISANLIPDSATDRIKQLLIETSFLADFMQHSNPDLQANIQKDGLQRKFNSTMASSTDPFAAYHKDFVIKEYERLVNEEVETYEAMIQSSEGFFGKVEEANVLGEGTFVNYCTMISPASYLHDYKLTFEGGERPVIAAVS